MVGNMKYIKGLATAGGTGSNNASINYCFKGAAVCTAAAEVLCIFFTTYLSKYDGKATETEIICRQWSN